MYFARGSNNAYNRQQQQQQQQPPQQQQQQSPYSPHSAYVPQLGSGYSVGLAEGAIGLRQSSMLRSHEEPEVSGFRDHSTHLSSAPHYGGGQYSSTYGSSTQQIPVTTSKGNASSALELHGVYGSGMPDSPKLTSTDYVSSSGHVYGHKREQLYADRIAAEYSPLETRQYGERHAYASKDPLTDRQASRYVDPIPYGHKLQHAEVYDQLEQAALMRQEQFLKAQPLQSSVLDGNSSQTSGRRANYLARSGQAIHQSAQEHNPVHDPIAYGGRLDSDPHNFSLGSSSFGGQHSSSILGAAPLRNIEDLMYDQKSSNPGYGVRLPAGRDYGTGKGLRRISLESDYPATLLTRGSLPIIDDHEHKENDHHRDLLRDREKDRERERLRERERERERARERERERDRERDREKARERERERERILERRDKERARVSKSGLESRRDRTPPRLPRDLRSSSLGKDAAVSVRRESPRREASHRRHSPVREKRKEYACKVHSFNLTEIQKDYLSLNKRYPRLLVSPDCLKVVLHWPKGNLKVSYNTPVSFEHDYVQVKDSLELKGSSGKQLPDGSGKYNQCTVWNAKLVLMSGLSQNALEDLLSDRNHGSRLPHLCNMLRFAILKKSSSFTLIGGPWDPVDGGDPSSDESSLVRTALRYAKELTNLDLKDCQHWNRFLEIHYDRIGKNGLYSHKEVTVIFLPDLTDCLPSLNTWRNQWLAYRKATIEREQQRSLRNEKPELKKEAAEDEADSLIKETNEGKQPEIKEEASPIKTESELKAEDGSHQDGSGREKIIENIDGVESGRTGNGLKDPEEGAGSMTARTTKMVKKKIIKKVVKQKVLDKKDGVETNTAQGVVGFEKGTNEQTAPAEVTQKQEGPSSRRPAVKTLVRKKIVKKVPVRKISKEGGDTPPAVTVVKEMEFPKDVNEGSAQLGQEAGMKTTTKRKIIKRVPKKKVSSTDANNVVSDASITGNMEASSARADKEHSQTPGMQNPGKLEQNKSHSKVENDVNTKVEPTEVILEKVQLDDKMTTDEKAGSTPKVATEPDKDNRSSKDLATSKDRYLVKENERSPHDRKDGSQAKKIKDVKDQKTRDEPPRHPGLLLQTKGTKDSKLQTLSLSLDSLLDYTEKDIEESTFEVSLFAESLYEMLQYEMGCRIFLFLQKLRLNFISKRNRRKRGRVEISKSESGKTTPEKRVKKDAVDGDNPSTNALMDEAATDNKNCVIKENTSSVNKVKGIDTHAGVKEEEDPEEDPAEDEEESEEEDAEEPEEDPEEEEMADANASVSHYNIKEENVEMHTDAKVENFSDEKVESSAAKIKISVEMDGGLKEQVITSVTMPDAKTNVHNKTVENNKKPSNGEMDKELLQAFRFFDRNRVGYIRVEDMRLIIHSLGKCLPHRDVKELVISALLESNTGRDDHILYEKLIRTADRKVEKSKSES